MSEADKKRSAELTEAILQKRGREALSGDDRREGLKQGLAAKAA